MSSMTRTWSVLILLTAVVALSSVTAAQAQTMTFVASLSGGGESPRVATGAFGDVEIVVDLDTLQADYTVRLFNIPPVVAAHIHVGSAGANGPVLYNLNPPAGSNEHVFRGRIDLMGDLAPQPERGIMTGRDVEQILRRFDGSNLYVNVHTSQNPPGEVRGQLMRAR